MIDADIFVNASVKCWERQDDQPFRPTRNWTITFQLKTSTAQYQSPGAVTQLSSDVYNFCAAQAITVSKTVLLQVTIDNKTAVSSGKGVVPMAKQHIDFALSGDEVIDAGSVSSAVNLQIANLLTRAKYT